MRWATLRVCGVPMTTSLPYISSPFRYFYYSNRIPYKSAASRIDYDLSRLVVESTTSGTRNRNLQTSKAPLKSQAQGTSLFTSAASKQRGFPIVRGRLRSGCQMVRVCVKSEGFSKE